MRKIIHKLHAATLVEITLAIAIMAILAGAAFITINPFNRVDEGQYSQALTELREIAKAVQVFALENGYYPADVSRGLPTGIEKYLTPDETWPNGPLDGSIYDYDNWTGQSCIDAEASGSVQITLREVPNRNPDGTDVWAWYYVIFGKGTPHCSNANEADKGECVNCPGFVL